MARASRLLLAVLVALSLISLAQPAPAQQPATATVTAQKRPGSAGDHSWLFNKKITWPSCGTITYRVNPSQAPTGWKQLVKKAVKKVKQATKLRFSYLGKTKVKPTFTEFNPPDTDVVIAFLNPGQTDMLGGPTVAGQGSAATDGSWLFDGKVVLNGKVFRKMAPGFGSGPRYGIQGTTGQVVMHELGHVLGLGHARHQTQVMFPAATRKPAEWGAGDWAGLRALGKGGCDQRPAAGPIRVHSLS
jgi:hypothetical protein